ncbi:GL14961 [Drosophila persimilis]|uniref:GL14961 n=1 Tax=Drosophila persimilis TaxID=7234 RepID=B4H0A1_DROPE|nr:GL14961 [Drosophila persimilis]
MQALHFQRFICPEAVNIREIYNASKQPATSTASRIFSCESVSESGNGSGNDYDYGHSHRSVESLPERHSIRKRLA